jgi:hypothetical protein
VAAPKGVGSNPKVNKLRSLYKINDKVAPIILKITGVNLI